MGEKIMNRGGRGEDGLCYQILLCYYFVGSVAWFRKYVNFVANVQLETRGPILHPAQLTLSVTQVSFLSCTRRKADFSLHGRRSK